MLNVTSVPKDTGPNSKRVIETVPEQPPLVPLENTKRPKEINISTLAYYINVPLQGTRQTVAS